MSENSITPISSIKPPETGTSFRVATPSQPDFETVTGVSAPAQSVSPKVRENEPVRVASVSNGSNVSIHFQIDEKTRDVTVFVVDRQSKQVLRTIPASELQKLQAGDLLKLTA